jgi:hypothetical protein
LQAASLRASRGNFYLSQAINQANNMAQFLQSHHGDGSRYLDTWQQQTQSVLPLAHALISGSYPSYQIFILWGGNTSDCTHNQSGISGCVVENINL